MENTVWACSYEEEFHREFHILIFKKKKKKKIDHLSLWYKLDFKSTEISKRKEKMDHHEKSFWIWVSLWTSEILNLQENRPQSTIIYLEEHQSLVHGGVTNRDIS